MTRFMAVAVLLGLATNVGCTHLRPSNCNNCVPCNVATSTNAPRPDIQRTACHKPIGVMNLPASPGCGRGCGIMGHSGPSLVNGCVDAILDCPGPGCGDACGCYGGCGGHGGCPQGCTCGGAGQCKACCIAANLARGVLDSGACMTDAAYNFNPGPPTGQVAYPYYTVRGPRDFFCNQPPSIGPR